MIRKLFLISLVGIIGILMTPNFSSAVATTATELQAQINALMMQIKALQAQLVQTQTTTQWCHDFNIDLKYSDSGEEVFALQIALEKDGFNINDEEQSKKFFGDSTASSVSGFQQKYADEILTPLRLKYGTGYVGKLTRTKLNMRYKCNSPAPILNISPLNIPPVDTPAITTSPAPVVVNDTTTTSMPKCVKIPKVMGDDGTNIQDGPLAGTCCWVGDERMGTAYCTSANGITTSNSWGSSAVPKWGATPQSFTASKCSLATAPLVFPWGTYKYSIKGTLCVAELISTDDDSPAPIEPPVVVEKKQISCNGKGNLPWTKDMNYAGYARINDNGKYQYRAVLDVVAPTYPECHNDTGWVTLPDVISTRMPYPITNTICTANILTAYGMRIDWPMKVTTFKTNTGMLTKAGGLGSGDIQISCTADWATTQ